MYSANAKRRREMLELCKNNAERTEVNRQCQGQKTNKNKKRDVARLAAFNERKRIAEEASHQPSQTSEVRCSAIESGCAHVALDPVGFNVQQSQTSELRCSSFESGLVKVTRSFDTTSEQEVNAKNQPQTLKLQRRSCESGTITVLRNFDPDKIELAERIDKPRSVSPSFGQGGEWRKFPNDKVIRFEDFAENIKKKEKVHGEWARIQTREFQQNRRVVLKSLAGMDEDESETEEVGDIDFSMDKEEEETEDVLACSPYDPCVME